MNTSKMLLIVVLAVLPACSADLSAGTLRRATYFCSDQMGVDTISPSIRKNWHVITCGTGKSAADQAIGKEIANAVAEASR